jgi:capsular polysaccharide biosynthesis protein
MDSYSWWDPLESAESDFGIVSRKLSYSVSGINKPKTTSNPYNLEWFPNEAFFDRVLNFEMFTVNIKGKCILGDRMIIDETSKMLTTDRTLRNSPWNSASSFFSSESRSFIEARDNESMYLSVSNDKERVKGRTAIALSAEPSNWGSFLFRIVPKLLKLKEIDEHHDNLLIYINHRNIVELLNYLEFDPHKIVAHDPTKVYLLEDSFIDSESAPEAHLPEDVIDLYRKYFDSINTKKTMLSNLIVNKNKAEKVYVSRLGSLARNNPRKMINELHLIDELKQIGFLIVQPEKLSFLETVKIFANAKVICGPSGAGMFNSIFNTQNAEIVQFEIGTDWLWAHTNYYSSLQLPYHILMAKKLSQEIHSPFEVNVKSAINLLKHL